MLQVQQLWAGEYAIDASVKDAGGNTVPVDAPTLTLLDGAGVEVADITLATDTLIITAPSTLPLDRYEARLSGTVDGAPKQWRVRFEIVGDFIFDISELRTYSDNAFANVEKYPASKLADARQWAEERIEHPEAAGVAFVPRSARERIRATGETRLYLQWPRLRSIISLAIDGTALSADELAAIDVDNMSIYRDAGFTGRIDVHYEHGYDEAPLPVREIALIAAKEYLVKNLSSRATAESTDVGFYRLSIAGSGGRTGIPECDAIIADERIRARGGRAWIG